MKAQCPPSNMQGTRWKRSHHQHQRTVQRLSSSIHFFASGNLWRGEMWLFSVIWQWFTCMWWILWIIMALF